MKVLILLSTWNGIRYLPTQLDSLFAQDFSGDLEILVRDDGSSDGTVDYICGLNDPRVRVLEGENVGPRGSFFALLRMARDEDADFIALCDQDDVWRPDKIHRALTFLDGQGPAIYASSLDLVDDALEYMTTFVHPGNRSFSSTLVCNFVTGCTCVFNRAFLEQMPFPQDPDRTIMHDWWLASVATLGARITYDRKSFIGYRQHAANHVGIKTGVAAMIYKLRRAVLEKPAVSRFDHARELLRSTGENLDEAKRAIVTRFLASEQSWLRRLLFVIRHRADIGLTSALRFVAFR